MTSLPVLPAIAALVLALAGCAARAPAPLPALAPGEVTAADRVTAPRFLDDDPHPWGGRGPAAHAVHGTDASRFQGNEAQWAVARSNGVNFVFLKATEGGDRADPAFAGHWREARAAGVRTGAYHVWYHCRPGAEQARWFIANVPRAPGALPPALDLEWTPFSPTCTRRPPGSEVRREAQAFVEAVAAHYGQRPLVYAAPDIWQDAELWRLEGVEFWLRSVAGHPAQVYPGQGWTFWQYSGTGRVPGLSGQADLNVFRGSEAEWHAWLARRAP